MTEYIRDEGLLSAHEVNRLIAVTPTAPLTQADFQRLGFLNRGRMAGFDLRPGAIWVREWATSAPIRMNCRDGLEGGCSSPPAVANCQPARLLLVMLLVRLGGVNDC